MRIEGKVGFDDSIDIKFQVNAKEKRTKSRIFKVQLPALELAALAFYLGWVFCLFWSPTMFSVGFVDQDIHLVRAGMAIAMAVAYVAFGLFAKFLARPKGEIFLKVCALVLSPLCCIPAVFAPASDLLITTVLWAMSGIGTSAILLVLSKRFVGLNRKQLIFTAALSFFIAAFLYLSTSFIAVPMSAIAIATLSVLASVLTFFAVAKKDSHVEQEQTVAAPIEEGQAITKQGEDAATGRVEKGDRSSFTRTILIALAYSVGIGFAGSCVTVVGFYPHNVFIIAAGNALAGVFTIFFLVKRTKNFMVLLTEIFLPCVLICIFIFSFAGYVGQLACLFFMFIIFACHDIIDITSISKKTNIFGRNYVKTFSYGRTLNGIGSAFGWVAGYIMNFQFAAGASERLFICFALVVFLVLATSFAVFHPNLISFYKNSQKDMSAHTIDGGIGSDHEPLPLRDRAHCIADMYGLTSRQEEVLYYLAQGRNSEYIRQKLVISNHTAKSHIYNIYAKIEIHSQQELLDIFEDIDNDGGREMMGVKAL